MATPKKTEQKPILAPNVKYRVTNVHGRKWYVNSQIGEVYRKKIDKPGFRGKIVKVEKMQE